MTNAELIKALKDAEMYLIYVAPSCIASDEAKEAIRAAANALEAAERLLDQNTERCEALRKQLRESHENYEKHLAELEAQIPKEGEWQWLSSTYDRVPCEMRYVCSACHHQEITHYDKPWKHYCPNCGANMKKGEEK